MGSFTKGLQQFVLRTHVMYCVWLWKGKKKNSCKGFFCSAVKGSVKLYLLGQLYCICVLYFKLNFNFKILGFICVLKNHKTRLKTVVMINSMVNSIFPWIESLCFLILTFAIEVNTAWPEKFVAVLFSIIKDGFCILPNTGRQVVQ